MSSRIFRAALVAGGIAVACVPPAFAQVEANLGALTPENAKKYLAPVPGALNTTLNSAMFQSAAIPLAGFNFTIGVHAMAVTFKDEDRKYRPTDPPGFTSVAPYQDAPTVIGSTQAVQQDGQGGTSVYYPGGLNLDQFEIAVPQITVGSVFGTRAMVRWVAFDVGDTELGDVALFGVGLQHAVSHYLSLPVDLAVGGMWQTFTLGANAVSGDDALLETTALHLELTASKSIVPWIQPYAAVGYDQLAMDVHYDQDIGGGNTQRVNLDFENDTSAHFTLGVLLGFPIVKLHAQFDAGSNIGGAIGIHCGFGS